jgi:hypothetical protein
MRALLEHAARARHLVESEELDATTTHALKQLVDFVFAACPATSNFVEPTRSPHTLYTHPNGRCCVTLEPNDLRTPYYEWRSVYGSWSLYDRHCWQDDALRLAAGSVRPLPRPVSSRPPPLPIPAGPPSVEIMPLEEQIRQLLLVSKDCGAYDGSTEKALECLQRAGFATHDPDVMNALWRVTRGIYYKELPFEVAAAKLLGESPCRQAPE